MFEDHPSSAPSPSTRSAPDPRESCARRGVPGHGSARPLVATLGALAIASMLWVGCGGKQVSRIDTESVTDLSGRWNDTDSRLVARALIDQSFEARWAARYAEANGGDRPTVIVGSFRNRTMEHVPVNTFLNDLERALLGSGQVQLVASADEREEIRSEREDQQQHARADSRADLGQELGADYMLQGELQAIEDEEGGEKIVFYQVDATLVDLESNARIWSGQHTIKKYIERSRFGF